MNFWINVYQYYLHTRYNNLQEKNLAFLKQILPNHDPSYIDSLMSLSGSLNCPNINPLIATLYPPVILPKFATKAAVT